MASQRRAIPVEEWERHRQTIIDLYSEKPLKDVRAEMEKLYDFKASPYQFETQLRNWGIRKNTKRKEWADLFEQVDDPESIQRTPAGCEKPQSSIKRARRYIKTIQRPLSARPPMSSRAPPNPTSPQLQDATTRSTTINHVQISNESSHSIDLPTDIGDIFANLEPRLSSSDSVTVGHQADLTSTQPWHETSDPSALDTTRSIFGSPFNSDFYFDVEIAFGGPRAPSLSPSQIALPDQVAAGSPPTQDSLGYRWPGGGIPSLDYNPAFDDNAHIALTDPRRTLSNDQNHSSLGQLQGYRSTLQEISQTSSGRRLPICNNILFPSHFIAFEGFLRMKGVSLLRPEVAGSGSWSPISRGFTSRVIAEVVLSKQLPLTRKAGDLEKALGRLETLISGESTTLITKDQAFETKFIRILLFSMLNGFAGLNDIPVAEMLKVISSLNIINQSFLAALKGCSTHAARTFVDTIFRATIEAKDENALKQLLEHSLVDIDGTVCFHWSGKYTPIERAASLYAYNLVAALLHYGADVNKTWRVSDYGGALSVLMQELSTDFRDSKMGGKSIASIIATNNIVGIIDLLVRAGARVTMRNLQEASQLFNTCEAVYHLFLKIPPSDHQAFFNSRNSCIANIARFSNDVQVSQIIRKMIDFCEEESCGRCLVEFADNVEHAAIEAAARGSIKIVQLLINFISSPTRVLCAAIRSKRKDLVDFILSLNPDFNPYAQHLRLFSGHIDTTPLAEAVKAGNGELIKHLHSLGAFSDLSDGNRLEPLIFAAAHQGNVSFMRQLLSHTDSSIHPYRVPSRVINIALQNGHDEVAWLLLKSGAGSNTNEYFPRPDLTRLHPLGIALQSQNKPLVHAILDTNICYVNSTDFDKAFEWEDTSIVADLLTVAAHSYTLPVDTETLQKLCQRCMRDDNIGFFQNFVESIIPLASIMLGLEYCLADAVKRGHSEMVCYLLDIGVSPFGGKVLEDALPNNKGMLNLLFEKRRSRRTVPKCIGARVLLSVMDESLDSPQALDALLETRAVNLTLAERIYCGRLGYQDGSITPLGLALILLLKTAEEDPWMARALLRAGSDPNGVAKSLAPGVQRSFTGLMVALETTRRDVVQLLLDSGADVNLKPRFAVKQTPLQHAAELGHLDMVCMLLEKGAEVNAAPAIRSGGSALQFAAISGNCNVANKLLANGALLEALPSQVEGRWPLEGAAEHGRLDMIQFLWNAAIDRGGSDLVDGFQRRNCLRAMSFARENGHMGCMNLISDLSGIPVDRLDVEDYGAPWLAYSDLSRPSSPDDWDMSFLADLSGQVDQNHDEDETNSVKVKCGICLVKGGFDCPNVTELAGY